ncbi:choline/ethanolamine kinase-like [Panonychus citri]|uniref:choline/ethanolamine kinase-like n=1 Tax=Panonychus citri TaxID=50023 RepID=UPI002306DDE6|nr:choline/ethanolamine kinase-like [Panonychus citri]
MKLGPLNVFSVSPSIAKTLCRSLLPSPWSDLSPEEITIEPITTGRSNRLFICTRPIIVPQSTNCDTISSETCSCSSSSSTTSSSSPVILLSPEICSQPSSSSDDDSDYNPNGDLINTLTKRESASKLHKVIVRFYGSDLTGEGNRYKCVSDEEEIKILTILSARYMSPNVLAVFPGGRIDEYIESVTFSPKQLGHIDILTILAGKIAQYHSTPFKCERIYDLVEIFRDNISQAIKILSTYDETNLNDDRSESSILLLRKIKNFLTGKPADQLTRKFVNVKHKTVFAHFDLNYTNFLFPKKSNNLLETKSTFDVMIIDVENSANNFRGIDLGKFFAELCIGDGSQDLYYIPDSAIEIFVDHYLNEWKSIVPPEQYDPETDNHDHLLLELQTGFLYNTIFNMVWNVLHPNFGTHDFLRNTALRIDVFNHYNQLWSQINQ